MLPFIADQQSLIILWLQYHWNGLEIVAAVVAHYVMMSGHARVSTTQCVDLFQNLSSSAHGSNQVASAH